MILSKHFTHNGPQFVLHVYYILTTLMDELGRWI